jgi:hypothetical protein
MRVSRGRPAGFPEPETGGADEPDSALRFTVALAEGSSRPSKAIDLSWWSRPLLASAFGAALRDDLMSPDTYCTGLAVMVRLAELRRFWRFLDDTGEPITTVEEVGPDLIDRYEGWLVRTGSGGPIHRRHLLARPIALLRRIEQERPGRLRSDLLDRLGYLSLEPYVPSVPRDAYDGAVAEALRAAAREQVREAASRIAPDGELPAVPEGLHPAVAERYAKVLEEIDRRGWLPGTDPAFDSLRQRAVYWGGRRFRWDDLHGRFYLDVVDVTAFIILLALGTGLEIECLTQLGADCLKNPRKGSVEIEYCKRRARGAEWKRLRVADRGSGSPGGLIRLALRLTARARRHKGSPLLFAHACAFGLVATPTNTTLAARYFVRRHKLAGPDGAPLRLQLARLRKTHKADWYVKTGGQLERFAVGHTAEVAANHYADIPALRHLHEQTVADALQDALEDALAPRIVTPDEEAVMRADPAGAVLPGVTPEETITFLDGARDLWLAGCGGFYSSPFGAEGAACPVPFWGCLECRNAVITASKLPALLAFKTFMIAQRELLAAPDWSAKFGRAYRRIVEQILPAFPEQVVTDAQTRCEAPDDLLYLPPEAQAR